MRDGQFTPETGRAAAKAREYFTQAEITEGLMALIAWAGNGKAASEYLRTEKGISVTGQTLRAWRQLHAVEYLELREKHAERMEKQLAHEYLDVAARAGQGAALAVEKAVDKLEADLDDDPGRTASNLARVAQSFVDKNRVLTDRPSRITETRGITEILRSLVASGVAQYEETTGDAPQLPEETDER